MFQFTREFIINDNGTGVPGTKGLLSDGTRFKAKDNTLMVARMVNLKKENIVSASKVAAEPAQNEKVILTPGSVTLEAGTVMRLIITIGQQGRVTALVNDYHPLHKKQYFYEAEVATANTLPLTDFVKIANKEAAMEEPDRLIKVSEDSGKLVVEALDPYTRINEVRIVSVPKAVAGVAEILTGYMDYDIVVLWKKEFGADNAKATGVSAVTFAAGSEGAGTVAQILKNKRLLTDANLDPYGFDLDERPIPGALYDQYLVEYVTERRHIGGQVFGAIDHSLTSVVFFVRANKVCESEDASSAFAAELGKVATIVTVEPAEEAPSVDEAETLPKDVIKKNVSKEGSASSAVSE